MPTLQALASKFTWYGATEADWATGDDIIASLPESGQNGTGGIRGISFSQCTQICLSIPNCKVVVYYPLWYGGPSSHSGWGRSGCFAKDQTVVPKLRGSTSSKPLHHKSFQGWSFWGYKRV